MTASRLVLLFLFALSAPAQTGPGPSLSALVASLPAQEAITPAGAAELDATVQAADLASTGKLVPALVADTLSPQPVLRRNAMLVLFAVASKRSGPPAGFPNLPLLRPYLSQLVGELHREDPTFVNLDLLVLLNLAADEAARPQMVTLLLPELTRQDANSVLPVPDARALGYPAGVRVRDHDALGPQVLWILLMAGSAASRDAATGLWEVQTSSAVREAVLAYLHRTDHTPATLAETVRVVALQAGADETLNDALLPLLDDADPAVRRAMLQWLPSMQLSPAAYRSARSRVQVMEGSAGTPEKLRTMARQLLGCWTNDRHHTCVVRPL